MSLKLFRVYGYEVLPTSWENWRLMIFVFKHEVDSVFITTIDYICDGTKKDIEITFI